MSPIPDFLRAFFTVRAVDPPGLVVSMLLGDGSPVVTSPGGWSITPRPRRVGLTEWEGYDPHTMAIPFLLDGFSTDRSVEPQVEVLRQMARKQGGLFNEPAKVVVEGACIPLGSWRRWVIADVTPDTQIRSSRTSQLIRYGGVINLLEYVLSDVIVGGPTASPAAAAAARNQSASSNSVYTAAAGETLSTIAAKKLGDAKRWPEIATLNGIRDPNNITPGQVLRLP